MFIKTYSRQEIIDEFWEFYQIKNRYVTFKDLSNECSHLKNQIKREFGSFKKLLMELNVKSDDGWYKEDEETLIKMFDDSPKEDIIDSMIEKRAWANILKKATKLGLRQKNETYKKEELLKLIIDFHDKYNRVPTIEDFKKLNYPSNTVYRKNFGGWIQAIELSGLEPNVKLKILSKQEKSEIISKYLDGVTTKEIANVYRCAESTIFEILKKNNIKLKNKKWTEEQIQFMKNNYHLLKTDEIVKELKVYSKQNIYEKAYELGLNKEDVYWSDKELKIIKDHYGETPLKGLQNLLPNRTLSSITTKAQKLNLQVYRVKWSDEELNILHEKYPIMSANELEYHLPNRHKNTITDMANNLGLKKDKDYFYKNEKHRKQQLINDLQKFAKELDRTPFQEEITANKEMAGMVTYHRYFDSYSNACIEAGLEPNHRLFGNKNIIVDKYGYTHLSKGENEITEFMINSNIKFEKNESLLYRNIFNIDDFGNKRFDWLINENIAVEYFGMMDRPEYNERATLKIKMCDDNNICLIELYPEDLNNSLQGVKEKLAPYINSNSEIKEEVV